MLMFAGFFILLGFSSYRGRGFFRRAQLHSCAAGFGKSDGDGLLGRAGSVFSFADVIKFFADEFSGLSGWRFALAGVFVGAFQGFSIRHGRSPPEEDDGETRA